MYEKWSCRSNILITLQAQAVIQFFVFINHMWRLQDKDEDRELELGSDQPEAPLPLTATSRVCLSLTALILSFSNFTGYLGFLHSALLQLQRSMTIIHCLELENLLLAWGIDNACRYCICWETSRQGLRLGLRNGSNRSVNALPKIAPLDSPTAPRGSTILCLLGYSRSLSFFHFSVIFCPNSARCILLIFVYFHRVNLCSNIQGIYWMLKVLPYRMGIKWHIVSSL